MRVLVTGGAGFLGANLCARLVSQGIDVTALDAFRPYAWPRTEVVGCTERRFREEILLSGTDLIRRDLRKQGLTQIVKNIQPNCIVHLAGMAIVGYAEKYPEQANIDILQSTISLLEVVRELPFVDRFVFVSSSMVYGNFNGNSVTESSPTEPINVYGALKLAGEIVTRAYLAKSRVQSVIVRPSAVYGPGDTHHRVVKTFCRNALAGLPLVVNNTSNNRIDFTYINDLIDGLIAACMSPRAAGQTFNLTYGDARDLTDLVNCLRTKFSTLNVITNKKMEDTRPSRGTLDINKARRLLSFNPCVSLDDGVGRYIAHLKKTNSRTLAMMTSDNYA